MTQEERIEALNQLTKITEHAARALYLELFAPLVNPDGLTAQILKLASTASTVEVHTPHRSSPNRQQQQQLALTEVLGEEDHRKPKAPAGRGRPPLSNIQDFRRTRDWCIELLNWGVSHDGIINLDIYREQKFTKDYPGVSSAKTRYAQGVNELKRLNLIKSAGRRKYTINDAGRRYLAANMNTPAPNTPTPPPTQPPPFIGEIHVPEPADDTEEEIPVVNRESPQQKGARTRASRKGMPTVLERLVNFAKKRNGVFDPGAYRQEQLRKGHSIPGGGIMRYLNDPQYFTKLGRGEYRLNGYQRGKSTGAHA